MKALVKKILIIIATLVILVFGISAYVSMSASGNIAGTDSEKKTIPGWERL